MVCCMMHAIADKNQGCVCSNVQIAPTYCCFHTLTCSAYDAKSITCMTIVPASGYSTCMWDVDRVHKELMCNSPQVCIKEHDTPTHTKARH